jgi:putative tricarboxylic transport membrane protein
MIDLIAAVDLLSIVWAFIGMAVGIFLGALPGFGGSSAIAIVLPVAITLSPINSMVFLINVYGGSHYGGGITSVMLGVPGDAAGAPTVFDGFPMTRNGQGSEALAMGAVGSFTGGFLSVIAFLFLAPPLARFALRFGPPEFFVLVVFGLTVLASVDPGRFFKGLFAGGIGMLLGAVGVDGYWGEPRMVFGVAHIEEGLPFVPALLGLFCFSQMLELINEQSLERQGLRTSLPTFGGIVRGMLRGFRFTRVLLQSSLVGAFIGALPGAGATIAAFVSYTLAKSTSRYPQRFGTGVPEGVIAPEAGNSSNVGGALIPTFALGIPGSGAAAVLMGVMMFMGLRPGPTLFLEQLPLIQTICMYLLFGCCLILVCGAVAAKYLYRVTQVPMPVLVPATVVAASVGAFAYRGEVFDVGVMIVMGVVGFVLARFRYPLSGVVLGLVLGPMAEEYFIESVSMSDWSLLIFFERPLCLVLWACVVLALVAARYTARLGRNTAPPAG